MSIGGCLMDLNALIKDFIYCKGNIRSFVNRRFRDPNKVVLITKYFDYIVTKEGNKFYVTRDLETVGECKDEYSFDGIDKDTVVVDLGANVGGFSIPAAKLARYVISYEPIRYNELFSNMKLNNIKNMEVNFSGLGDGRFTTLHWREKKKAIPTAQFEAIFDDACDYGDKIFLKCDVEGAEKHINPDMLFYFEGVEMELHYDYAVCQRIVDELNKTHNITIKNRGAYGIYGIMSARRK
jgi:FkbM family methyltransferase